MPPVGNRIRLVAIGDLHCSRTAHTSLQGLFDRIGEEADVLALCGDLTESGQPDEARILARELTDAMKIPIVAVLGNHDWESGHQEEVRRILSDAGVAVLDGDAVEARGVGFAGVKGFAGGFGRWTLGAWGEEPIKRFVHEAVHEALKLEAALAKVHCAQRIALLHYAPVESTVEGEPREIYAYLGSGRLEDPINRYGVTAVFHGHAHHGTLEGRTAAGIPVFNVALPLLRARLPGRMPFRVFDVPIQGGAVEGAP